MDDVRNKFKTLLQECVKLQASDLHLSAGTLPILRNHGRLEPLGEEILTQETVEAMSVSIIPEEQQEVFEREHTLDLAFSLETGDRFRINFFHERGRVAMAVRRLDNTFRTLKDLHLPPKLNELVDLKDGLVLVTGPTGSGKSTTLATLIHQINETRACHILTVEDPIEFVHENNKSLIHQRELYKDVPSFAQAVRSSLREDPDVILVGEMRDIETMRAAITAAETGHLVYSTLHTGNAVGAIERMVGLFPGEEQSAVRQQLSLVLRAVVAQRLLPSQQGDGRIPAVEVLRVTPAVGHLIRIGKSEQIYSAIESGVASGMQTLEQSLAVLASRGLIKTEDARHAARDLETFEERLRRQGNPAFAILGEED